jgi:hypothetical protein
MNLLWQAIGDDSVWQWKQTPDCFDAFAAGRSASPPVGP